MSSLERPYAGKSLKERSQARRNQLIDAGIEVFGTKGFRWATVKSVCHAAELTERYFYESFPNMEALLAECFLVLAAGFKRRALELAVPAFRDGDQGQQVQEFLHASYTIWFDCVQDPRFARIFLVEMDGVSPYINEIYAATKDEFARLNSERLYQIFPDFPVTSERYFFLAQGMVGVAMHLGRLWMDKPEFQKQELVSACVTMALGSLTMIQRELCGSRT